MKKESLQKKRRPSRGGLFVFHSKTRRRKKQRVTAGSAADADLGSEVPNLGVARALFVILVLHVAAIGAIFIHNRVTEDDPVVPETGLQGNAAAIGFASGSEKLPQVKPGEDYYFVATGDTYQRIARIKNVDETSLRDLNDNVKLKAGRILRVPAAGAVPPPPVIASNPPPAPAPEPVPVRVTPELAPAPSSLAPVVIRRDMPAEPIRIERPAAPVPVKVSPNVVPVSNTPPVATNRSASRGKGNYTVKTGDTVWGISQRHKISPDSLLKANGISDPRKLRIGMTLTIPAN